MWPFKAEEGREEEVSKMRASGSGRSMSEGTEDLPLPGKQRHSVGPKPTNVKTIARKNARSGGLMSPTSDKPNSSMNNMMREAQRNYTGSFIKGSLGGVNVSNPSSVKFYGRKVMP